jgi:pantetheine-phosphate adenylyltransferase
MEKIAVYAGSFDPFTNGHMSIVKEAAAIFDRVYVVLARNTNKKRFTNVMEMRDAIAVSIAREGLDNCHVQVLTDGLVADYCRLVDAQYLVRGLRNTSDYMYEENIAKINHEINPDLKTVYFRADNEVISSSMVRELFDHGKDIAKYVPEDIMDTIRYSEE